MKVTRLKIRNFRGIHEANIVFPKHVVLIGDNNTGKSTIFEALDLALGPDRINRNPVIDEHDFYEGKYVADAVGGEKPLIQIEVTITDLSNEQKSHFQDYLEWWDLNKEELHISPPPSTVDPNNIDSAVRISFIGEYDEEEDDFKGSTYYSRSLEESEKPIPFLRRDKYLCGFLYLRTLRTGSRALSLEHGSLLDIILRLKELRPQIWEKTISEVGQFDVASDPVLGISGILQSIEKAIQSFVPKEWGIKPHLKVSNLTREHLRKIITAFIATGAGGHAAPFYRQGSGTINILVLAMLSQIAEERQNVIFAMEEPEIAIPPYTQKQIVHEIQKLSSQSLFSTHSPYVIEEFSLSNTLILSRNENGLLKQSKVALPEGLKLKAYRQDFRHRICEGLLSRKILIVEGQTEATSISALSRRLAILDPSSYSALEAMGICIIDAGGDNKIVPLAKMFSDLGKRVFALCDKQESESELRIRANVETLYMHNYKGFENLVLNNTTMEALGRFSEIIEWPPHLSSKYPEPKSNLNDAMLEYFIWSKGNWGVAEFISQCGLLEIPNWLRLFSTDIIEKCKSTQKSIENRDVLE